MRSRAIAAAKRGQRAAEELMIDDCILERKDGKPITDPTTGKVTQPMARVYPTEEQVAGGNPGRCKLQSVTAQATQPRAGDHRFTAEQLILALPVGTPAKPGDVATLTRCTLVPTEEGHVFRLVELERKSLPTAARWAVELVTA